MNVIELEGKYAEAKIFANSVEQGAMSQLFDALNHPAFKGNMIRVMPDVHSGTGVPIGFTSTYTDKIIPSMVGVDIGCGVMATNVGCLSKSIDFDALDSHVRKSIPMGMNINSEMNHIFKEALEELKSEHPDLFK